METKFLKQSKINFSKEVNNYYPEILTDEALNFLTALHENLIKKDYRY
jgi:malate synthase